MQQLLLERIKHRSPFACVLLVFSCVMTFKISLIYVQGCEKRNHIQIYKHGPKIRSENSNFVILDRQYLSSSCRDLDRQLSIRICPTLMKNSSSLVSWTNLHGFNTRLELLFFEILNTSQIYPITSKVRFVKGLANSNLTYVPNIKSHMS